MIRTLLLATVLLFAGCIEPSDTTTQSASAVDASPTGVSNATQEAAAPVVTVETDAAVTRAETVTLFVNTTAPVELVVSVDGVEALTASDAAPTMHKVPLGFGMNLIDVEVSAPGFSQAKQLAVVRLGKTTLSVDYGVFHPGSQGAPRVETFDVWIDVDARPAAAAYTDQGIEHIDLFTAHDQLVLFDQATGKKVVFEYFPSFEGFGVSRIDGAGSAISSDAPPWWCYTVNAGSADGISIQPVVPGDVIAWKLGSCA